MNAHPLGPLSADIHDTEPLTGNHLLHSPAADLALNGRVGACSAATVAFWQVERGGL